MADNNTEGIRIVKKKIVHGGHHGGAWKVAYADFVTALMAFFLVMWIVGLSQNIRAAVAGYFQDPTGFMEAVRNGGRAPFSLSERETGGKNKQSQMSLELNERKKLQEAKDTLEKMVAATPEFKKLKSHIDIKLVDEGLRVDLVEGQKSLFFDAGSAKIKPSTQHLLAQIAMELRKLPNKVIIEGHTDNRPLSSGFQYSNWELSADRANSARKVMEMAGLQDKQVAQVRGYAATQPRDPEHPEDFCNRRVSIIVVLKGMLQKEQFGNTSMNSPANTAKPGSLFIKP